MPEVTARNAGEWADKLAKLVAPFEEDEVKLKPQIVKANRALAIAYVDARAVMDRLDAVFGLGGWQAAYRPIEGGVVCSLKLLVAGEWVVHEDVGSLSEQPDEGDRVKAAFSDSLKRAAVHVGIGRYLYRRPQVWMDYDPVKKQIVRPGESKPGPAKASAPPDAALVRTYGDRLAACKSRAEFEAVFHDAQADKRAGKLTEGGFDAILIDFKAVGQRFPKAAAAK